MTPGIDVAKKNGIAHKVHEYDHDTMGPSIRKKLKFSHRCGT